VRDLGPQYEKCGLEAAGKATGNRRLGAKGRADKAEGRVRSAVGNAKDAIRELVGDKH
jgi:uncharacterized protein YjbJ (UPF0337 family)